MGDVAEAMVPADELAKGTDEQWEVWVRQGRFPDRYCEGLVRDMAEALWAGVLRGYPGLVRKGFRPALPLFAGGVVSFKLSWAVGRADMCIAHARTCAHIADARALLGADDG